MKINLLTLGFMVWVSLRTFFRLENIVTRGNGIEIIISSLISIQGFLWSSVSIVYGDDDTLYRIHLIFLIIKLSLCFNIDVR